MEDKAKKSRRTVKQVEEEYELQIAEIRTESAAEVDKLQKELEVAAEENERLQREIQALETELNRYRLWKENMQKGGRKQILSEQDKEDIVSQRLQGYTIRKIAENRGVSIGLIHKVLKEKGYTW